MRAVLVAGMPGAGKGEFVKVAELMGYKVLRMGEVVRGYARAAGIPEDDATIGGFASKERETHGSEIWARRTLTGLEDRMVIEGVRSMAELRAFREALGREIVLVAVVAGLRRRYERLVDRDRADAPEGFNEFLKRDERELGWGLGGVIASADLYLVNDGGIEVLRADAARLLKDVFETA
ncbi:MAG: AAA family ATPase [Candidatus Thermoplasmatota archaeon]